MAIEDHISTMELLAKDMPHSMHFGARITLISAV
jgi:hypothetical protein